MSDSVIDYFIDRNGVRSDKEFIVSALNDVYSSFKQIEGIKIDLSGLVKTSDIVNGTKQAAAANDSFALSVKTVNDRMAVMNGTTKEFQQNLLLQTKAEKEAANTELAKAKTVNEALKSGTAKSKQSVDTTKQLKAEEKATADAANEYKQLSLAYNEAALRAKNLQIVAPNSRAAKDATTTAKALHDQLLQIDQTVGQSQRNVGNYGSAIEKAGASMKDFGKQILAVVGIASLFQFLKGAAEDFLELDKNTRLFENTLKNIGSPQIFDRLEREIEALQKQFTYLNKADITSIFQRLIVYGKLTETQINELLPVIVNFSAQTGKSLEESTGILIKSLEGNNRGLKEFGINIKDAKSPAEAFSLVMKELAPRVEGVGKAFEDSAAGGIAKSQEQFKELKEEIGSGILPVLNSLLRFLVEAGEGAKALFTDLKNVFDLKGRQRAQAEEDDKISEEIAQKNVDRDKKELESLNATNQAKINAYNNFIAYNDRIIKQKQDDLKNTFVKQGDGVHFLTDKEQDQLKNFISTRTKEITLYKDAIDQLNNANKILGNGDPTKDFTKEHHQIEDFGKEVAKTQADIDKANHEALAKKLQDEIDADAAILASDRAGFNEKLRASQDYYDKSFELIESNKKFEIQANADAVAEEKRQVNEKLNDKNSTLTVKQRQDLNKELLLLDQQQNASDLKIDSDYFAAVGKLNRDSEKQITDVTKQAEDARKKVRDDARKSAIDHEKNDHDIDLQQIQNEYDEASNLLERRFAKGEITQKQYDRRKLLLTANLQKDLIQSEIDYTKQIIAEEKIRFQSDEDELREKIDFAKTVASLERDPEKKKDELNAIADAEGKYAQLKTANNDIIAASEEKLAALQIKLSTVVADFKVKKNKDTADDNAKLFGDIASAAQAGFELVQGFADAAAEKEKNRLQSQIDLLEQKKAKDIEIANQTIANEQDKAAAITVINDRAAAQEALLQQKQKQEDQKKAQFEKAEAIFSIILNTAKSIVADLKTPEKIPFDIAIGAAELAVAIATPIPKYRTGKNKNDAYEGPAIVGDGGKRELIIRDNGKMEITPAQPTMTFIKSKDVILPDANVLFGMAQKSTDRIVQKGQDYLINANSYFDSAQVVSAVAKMEKSITAAIKNKKEVYFERPSIMDRVKRHKEANREYFKMNGL